MINKGIIFDLDGVIVDTAKYHYLAWKDLADVLGFEFTEKDNERLKGVSRVRSLEILLEIGRKTLPQSKKDAYLKEKNEAYLDYVNQMTADEILPGVLPILEFLDSKAIPYALGSASKNAPLILEKVGLKNRFNAIVDGNAVSKAKPDPEVFLLAAQELGVEPKNCIVFEDAIAGIQAAKNAGMLAIGIGDKATLTEADYVFNDNTEITTTFLEDLLKK
ncbi:MAG: beta-phosphoglucomutase [Flavobacteriales bacterium]|nr:MAG: beta-phosphoglucomutase [Flavobacteriales bacterium]